MRPQLLAALLAFGITLAYGATMQPEWESRFNDQQQYLALARGLVERGEFTRAMGSEPFIPETNRLPGYPLLIAPLCVGGCDHWRIAIAQALAFAALVLTAHALARRVTSPRRAMTSAFLVALFLPFGFWGALALSDLPGTLMTSVGVALWAQGLHSRRRGSAVAAGALLGLAVLMRASLVLLPVALAVAAIARDRRSARLAVASLAAFVIVLAPYVTYAEVTFGRVSASTSGAVLWIGALQARSEASLDDLERVQVAAARQDIAAFNAIADRAAAARAWLELDDSLAARARVLIAHDPVGWFLRGGLRSIELWSGDRPAPGGIPGDPAVAVAALELALTAVGMFGVVRLARDGSAISAIPLIVVAYVWITALPFGTEARYALPARAFLLMGVAASSLLSRSTRGRAPAATHGTRPNGRAAPGA